MTALDITTSRDYFKIRLNEIYIDLLYYLSYPIESQNTKLPAPNDLDAQIEQINKNMFKNYKAKDYIKSIRPYDSQARQLFLYVKLRNKVKVQNQIGPFALEFKLYESVKDVANNQTQKTNKVTLISSNKFNKTTANSKQIAINLSKRNSFQILNKIASKSKLFRSELKHRTADNRKVSKRITKSKSSLATTTSSALKETDGHMKTKSVRLLDIQSKVDLNLPSPVAHAVEPNTAPLVMHPTRKEDSNGSVFYLQLVSTSENNQNYIPSSWSDLDVYVLPMSNRLNVRSLDLQLQISMNTPAMSSANKLDIFKESNQSTLSECLNRTNNLQCMLKLNKLVNDKTLFVCLHDFKQQTSFGLKSEKSNSVRLLRFDSNNSSVSSFAHVVPNENNRTTVKPMPTSFLNRLKLLLTRTRTSESFKSISSKSNHDSKSKTSSKSKKKRSTITLDLELQLGCQLEVDLRRRLQLLYNQVDLYVVLALEGKLELENMQDLLIHCNRWQELFAPLSIQLLQTARIHQSLSSHEDAICRTLALARLLARHARVRVHSFLNQALANLLARGWKQSAASTWPRALQRDLDDQLLEVLELMFRADMPAALLTLQRHNYSRFGRYLFINQVSLVIRVVALRRWLAYNHFGQSSKQRLSRTPPTPTSNELNLMNGLSYNLNQFEILFQQKNLSLSPAFDLSNETSQSEEQVVHLTTKEDAPFEIDEEYHTKSDCDVSSTANFGKQNSSSNERVPFNPINQYDLYQNMQICLHAPINAAELPFVASLAKGFERAAKLWLRYMESQKPPSNLEELVYFSKTLEHFCCGLVQTFRPLKSMMDRSKLADRKASPKKMVKSKLLKSIATSAAGQIQKWTHKQSNSNSISSPESEKSQNTLKFNNENTKEKRTPQTSKKNTNRWIELAKNPKAFWARFESLEQKQMQLNAIFTGPLPKSIQQTLRSIHVMIDYHLCNWIPFPLKILIEQLALPSDYSEATEQVKRNAIFQATPYKEVYNSLRVAISYLNSLHDEPIPIRISLSTIQGWFPLSVTQAWVAQETLKIKQECATWSDYLKDFVSTSNSKYTHLKKKSMNALKSKSTKSLIKRPSLSAVCPDGKQLHLEHLVELAECMYENLIAFVSWPDAVFPARTARDIVYSIDLVAVVLKTWYQKQETERRRIFEQQYRGALESFVEHIRFANERLNENPFVDPEYRVNVSKWMRHQEGCWCGVLLSLQFDQLLRKQTDASKSIKS